MHYRHFKVVHLLAPRWYVNPVLPTSRWQGLSLFAPAFACLLLRYIDIAWDGQNSSDSSTTSNNTLAEKQPDSQPIPPNLAGDWLY